MKAVPRDARPWHARRSPRAAAALLVLGTLGSLVMTSSPVATAAGVVSGTVYRDANNNGVRDAGEAGIAGIVMSATTGAGTTSPVTTSTVTASNGSWSLSLNGAATVRAVTGWYRSQCSALTCSSGPGRDQDFGVAYQVISAAVVAENNPVVDLGLIPDWAGGYPIPSARPIPANAVDVSARVSFVAPTGATGSNCFRTTNVSNRACAVGDQPSFNAQVYNEGTTSITNAAGYLELPAGTTFVSMTPSTSPGNHPAIASVTLGAFNSTTRRLPVTFNGTLPPGAAAVYTVKLLVLQGAPITTSFQTGGSYPNPIGLRITSLTNDAERDSCTATAATCAWGQTNKQVSPDNSDTVGFAIVAGSGTAPTTTVPPATTSAPTTTAAAVTTTAAPTTTAAATTTTVRATTTTQAATTVPLPTNNTGTCRVSSLLVPSCGAWLGASTAAKSGKLNTSDYAIGLNEYEAVAQNTPDILHFYKNGAQRFPNSGEIAMAERAGKQRSLLFYNWKPGTMSWRQIANGAADSAIATVASSIKAYDQKIFLTIWHEPEDNLGSAGSGNAPADYVAMYRYVVTELRSLGVDNAVFVMNYMGFYGWADVVDSLWPGADYVDWIAYDPYGFKMHNDFGMFLDTANRTWPGFYSWATNKAPGKPIMLAEWGFDLTKQPDSPAILDGAVPIIQRDFPMLKALVYWHDHAGNFSVRIDQTTTLGIAYGQAYRRFANNAYFNQTSTSGAP